MERPGRQRPAAPTFDQGWREHRRYLLDVAYRMLGSLSEAEDVVQEAFVRLVRAGLDQIQDVRGWLVVVVGGLCLDQLRSARSQRQAYVGPWLPEPLIQPQARRSTPPSGSRSMTVSAWCCWWCSSGSPRRSGPPSCRTR